MKDLWDPKDFDVTRQQLYFFEKKLSNVTPPTPAPTPTPTRARFPFWLCGEDVPPPFCTVNVSGLRVES